MDDPTWLDPEAIRTPSPAGDGLDDAPGTATRVRVNFSVDLEAQPLRGVVVVPEWIERDFEPTAQLLDEAKERRQRRRRWRRRLRER